MIDKYEVLFRKTEDPLIAEIEYLGEIYLEKLLNPVPATPDILEFSHSEWVKSWEAANNPEMWERVRTLVPRKKTGEGKRLTAKQKKEMANSEISDEAPIAPVFGQINPLPKKRAKKK